MSEHDQTELDLESINDRLAREHPIDAYYTQSPWQIRFVERRRLEIIRRMVGSCEQLQLAEIGSGGGHVLRMFPQAHLTAIDVSSVFLEQARKNLRGFDVRFLKGQVHKLQLDDASFDRIICTEVLEHVPDPAQILAEISRLLRPDGFAIITVPNDPPILRLKQLLTVPPIGTILRQRVDWGGDDHHLHRWKPREFRRLLERHLHIVEQRSAPVQAVPLRVCFRCQRL